MKSFEKDKHILKGIMEAGVKSPENERFTQDVLDRIRPVEPEFKETESSRVTFPWVLLIVLSFLVILSTFMVAFLGNVSKISEVLRVSFIEELTDSITGLVFYSPLFVMIFMVIFLLYRFDRFLSHKMSVR